MNGSDILALVLLGVVVFFFGLILYFVPIGLWITALFSGVRVRIATLIGMRLRKVPPGQIVRPLISATKAEIDLEIGQMEAILDLLVEAPFNGRADLPHLAEEAGVTDDDLLPACEALALLQLATLLQRQGDSEQAAYCLERLLHAHPDHVHGHTNQSILLSRQGQWPEAQAACQRALAIDPGFLPALRQQHHLAKHS